VGGGKNLYRVHIPAQEYAVLSASGPQPQALMDTWQAVWQSDLDRTYAADYEEYGPRFFEEGVHEVLVHIGVK
jgi:predicted transcriptional regulator YdeE